MLTTMGSLYGLCYEKILTVVGILTLSHTAWNVYLFNHEMKWIVNSHSVMTYPKMVYLELVLSMMLILYGILASLFVPSSPSIVLKEGVWTVSLMEENVRHPLRSISISRANSYTERMGKSTFAFLETRPSFASLPERALSFQRAVGHMHATEVGK